LQTRKNGCKGSSGIGGGGLACEWARRKSTSSLLTLDCIVEGSNVKTSYTSDKSNTWYTLSFICAGWGFVARFMEFPKNGPTKPPEKLPKKHPEQLPKKLLAREGD
jgi:hypothetical protein